jgi:cyclic 2,3-diphosphoglycerate synthetase
VIALVDGEHHPAAVRDALDRLDVERGLAGVVFCGGEEKLADRSLDEQYGRALDERPVEALRRLAGEAGVVVDLADEPIVPATRRLRLAALALALGLRYEAPGLRLDPPRYAPVPFDGPKLAVTGTGKRTGKTAVAGHWARRLAARGLEPVVVCMGRGGPPEPRAVDAGIGVDDLLALADMGLHAASDYLEDAVLAGVRTVGCRRVGGGPNGEPWESNVAHGASLAASLGPGAIVFEGSGACVPPVAVDATVCVAGGGTAEPFVEHRLLAADLVLATRAAAAAVEAALGELGGRASVVRFELRPEPAEAPPEPARVALFTTGSERCEGVEPVLLSTRLADRAALASALDRAAAERCDVYLTELKAAAIDTVARRARQEGARLIFVRNTPVGLDDDLDAALMALAGAD